MYFLNLLLFTTEGDRINFTVTQPKSDNLFPLVDK